jgi:hypothetical protein
MATPASAAPTIVPVLPLPQEKALRSPLERLELLERVDVPDALEPERFALPRARVVLLSELSRVRVAMWCPPCWFGGINHGAALGVPRSTAKAFVSATAGTA